MHSVRRLVPPQHLQDDHTQEVSVLIPQAGAGQGVGHQLLPKGLLPRKPLQLIQGGQKTALLIEGFHDGPLRREVVIDGRLREPRRPRDGAHGGAVKAFASEEAKGHREDAPPSGLATPPPASPPLDLDAAR
jgi:hypothetical protein